MALQIFTEGGSYDNKGQRPYCGAGVTDAVALITQTGTTSGGDTITALTDTTTFSLIPQTALIISGIATVNGAMAATIRTFGANSAALEGTSVPAQVGATVDQVYLLITPYLPLSITWVNETDGDEWNWRAGMGQGFTRRVAAGTFSRGATGGPIVAGGGYMGGGRVFLPRAWTPASKNFSFEIRG